MFLIIHLRTYIFISSIKQNFIFSEDIHIKFYFVNIAYTISVFNPFVIIKTLLFFSLRIKSLRFYFRSAYNPIQSPLTWRSIGSVNGDEGLTQTDKDYGLRANLASHFYPWNRIWIKIKQKFYIYIDDAASLRRLPISPPIFFNMQIFQSFIAVRVILKTFQKKSTVE